MIRSTKATMTASLAMELDYATQLRMISTAFSKLRGSADFVIFDPIATEENFEDQGRTVRIPWPGVNEKCYGQIDDYGGDTGRVLTIYKASER